MAKIFEQNNGSQSHVRPIKLHATSLLIRVNIGWLIQASSAERVVGLARRDAVKRRCWTTDGQRYNDQLTRPSDHPSDSSLDSRRAPCRQGRRRRVNCRVSDWVCYTGGYRTYPSGHFPGHIPPRIVHLVNFPPNLEHFPQLLKRKLENWHWHCSVKAPSTPKGVYRYLIISKLSFWTIKFTP